MSRSDGVTKRLQHSSAGSPVVGCPPIHTAHHGRVAPRAQVFHLFRADDPSGVSGTGCVAEGVVFSNGCVVLMWLSDIPSVSVYASLEAVETVHGHHGKTQIVFDRAA